MKRLAVAALLLGASSVFVGAAGQRQVPHALPDGSALLPNGWSISPAGKQVPLGGLPLRVVPLADGRHVLVTSNGYGPHFLAVADTRTGEITQKIPLVQAWMGLTLTPDGRTAYAAAGSDDRLLGFQVAEGRLIPAPELRLSAGTFPAGIACGAGGERLYVTGNLSNSLLVVERATGHVLHSYPVGTKPYTCAVAPDERTAFVSNWGGDTVSVIDLTGEVRVRTIRVQDHPNDLALTPDGNRLFVANGSRNTVSVVDTRRMKVVEQIDAALTPRALPGSTPNALALSRDGKTLFVADADSNAVAVIDVAKPAQSIPRGFIPTGWYPTAVATLGGKLVIANGKGGGSRPNAPEWKGIGGGPGYIGRILDGTLSVVDAPDPRALDRYTEQSRRNSPYAQAAPPSPAPFPLGKRCPIRHVVYLIKENRTYDQVLGDMPEGNGDANYCLFPEEVTPNHHAIAREFVLLDNLYHNADVSNPGHFWVNAAYATDYVEKFWPSTYSQRATKGRTPVHDDPEVYPSSGFLWDLCARAGLSYRSYGEFARVAHAPPGGVYPATRSLIGHVHPTYRGSDAISSVSDSQRLELWLADLREFERKGDMPRFQVFSVPGDHTVGTKVGAQTPRAMVAENDLAVGKMVEARSRSRFWKDTAVFVVEDDAQNGPDHVDAHRTVALLAGPYVRRHGVDSTMYSTASILHTMELLLGLPPMTQFDASAPPMWASFQAQADLTPYTARPARIPLDEKNSQAAYGAARSRVMDLDEADEAPDDELNEILWRAVKGPHAALPPRNVSAVAPVALR